MTDDRPHLAVIGAGPAGLAATVAAAAHGVRVTLIDSAAQAGGQFYRRPAAELNARRPQALHHQWRTWERLRNALAHHVEAGHVTHLTDHHVWLVERGRTDSPAPPTAPPSPCTPSSVPDRSPPSRCARTPFSSPPAGTRRSSRSPAGPFRESSPRAAPRPCSRAASPSPDVPRWSPAPARSSSPWRPASRPRASRWPHSSSPPTPGRSYDGPARSPPSPARSPRAPGTRPNSCATASRCSPGTRSWKRTERNGWRR